jgi:PadR family transcriptional regulator AphA
MAAEHALLGLLALDERGAGHGYDLARHFETNEPLGNVIRLEPGMVYHHLKKLERLGWAEALAEPQGRPARRLIALTVAGRVELARWLAEPVTHTREIRLDFLVKLYFALVLDPGLAVRLIDEQRERSARQVEALTVRLLGSDSDGGAPSQERRFGDMVLDMRLAQTRAALEWLDRVGREASIAAENAGSPRNHLPSTGSTDSP